MRVLGLDSDLELKQNAKMHKKTQFGVLSIEFDPTAPENHLHETPALAASTGVQDPAARMLTPVGPKQPARNIRGYTKHEGVKHETIRGGTITEGPRVLVPRTAYH